MTDGFVDEQDALRIHQEQIVAFGGEEGVLNRDNLLSALGAVVSAYHYGLDNIEELAAMYVARIAQAHPFIDGNKRTAASCALHFLHFHDVHTDLTNEELSSWVLDIVEGRKTPDELAVFLRYRLHEISPSRTDL